MVECRSCRGFFRALPEKIGARCPKCRAPLFEKPERRGENLASAGKCATHAAVDATAACQRCGKNICATCRTRWHGQSLCVGCVEQSLSRAEPNPRELAKQGRRAIWSLTLAIAGWMVALPCGAWLIFGALESSLGAAVVFGVLSVAPSLWAVGQGCSVLLARGPRFRVAATGMILAGAHLGLLLGVVLVNVWHN